MGHQNWFIKGIRAAFEPSKDPKYRTHEKEQADEGSRTENNRGRRMRQWSPNGAGLLSKPPDGTGGETRLQTVPQSINVEGRNGFQQVSNQ